MLPLPDIELLQPTTLDEAVAALSERDERGAAPRLLAGGTDLVPNLKHGLYDSGRLVSLRRVAELRALHDDEDDGALVIGAGVTLATVARNERIRARYPALAEAASLVASPQIRSSATLGGNICLDTRCLYYNQTEFWRHALGYCIKRGGEACHIVEGGSRCVAALAADTPAPLCCYGATVRLVSTRGERQVPIDAFYRGDGARHTVCEPDEIVVDVRLPAPPAGTLSAYAKLRRRDAIDFPQLAVALAVQVEADEVTVRAVDVVIGALQSRPRRVALKLDVRGRALDEQLVRDVAAEAAAKARPLPSVVGAPDWRQRMTGVLTARAFARLVASR